MKKYEKYKDTNIEWYGEIPVNWDLWKLNHLFSVNTGFTPPTGNNEFYENGHHNWITIADMDGKFVSESKTKLTDLAVEGKEIVPKGSLLYSFKLSVGKTAFATEDVYTNEAIFSIYPSDNLNLSYFYYLLGNSLIHNANENIYGAKILNQELIKSSKLLVPPEDEQSSIASYLDFKVGQLDTLISKKIKLIGLLEEEGRILIHDTITRGLNPKAKYINSSIDWLGEIPSHWQVKRIRFVFEIVKRISGEIGPDVLSVTQRGIKIKDITSGAGQLSMDYSKYQLVFKGDFVMNHMDLLTGFADRSPFDGVTSPDYRVFRPISEEGNSDYFKYLFQMFYHEKIFFPLGQGSAQAGRWRLPTIQFKDFKIPVPPANEQQEIALELSSKLETKTNVIKRLENEIALLNEYKKSLIHDVVTGKVDVRNENLN